MKLEESNEKIIYEDGYNPKGRAVSIVVPILFACAWLFYQNGQAAAPIIGLFCLLAIYNVVTSKKIKVTIDEKTLCIERSGMLKTEKEEHPLEKIKEMEYQTRPGDESVEFDICFAFKNGKATWFETPLAYMERLEVCWNAKNEKGRKVAKKMADFIGVPLKERTIDWLKALEETKEFLKQSF